MVHNPAGGGLRRSESRRQPERPGTVARSVHILQLLPIHIPRTLPVPVVQDDLEQERRSLLVHLVHKGCNPADGCASVALVVILAFLRTYTSDVSLMEVNEARHFQSLPESLCQFLRELEIGSGLIGITSGDL